MHAHSRVHLWTIIVALFLAFSAAFVMLRLRNADHAKNQNGVKFTEVKTESQVNQVSQKVYVTLPNADPIEALDGDYAAPSSLWVIVSKDFPLSDQHFRPSDVQLTTLPVRADKSTDEKSVRAVIVPDLTAMFADARSAGNDIMIASGFRSYELQQTYFGNYSRTYGEEAANMFSALPGQSEHQTGLSLDIAYVNRDCYLEICFGKKPAGMWLAEHAYQYGFVLRYPAHKTDSTKYQYEPWHFRYVGKPLALALHQSDLTLDEAKPYLDAASAKLKKQQH